jgi:intergrase/recombinase
VLKRIGKEHDNLCKQLTNTKKSLKDKIENAYRKDYFFCIYNKIIKRQLEKTVKEEDVEPVIQYQLEE